MSPQPPTDILLVEDNPDDAELTPTVSPSSVSLFVPEASLEAPQCSGP
jgi:hypothetical protein